MKKIIATLLSLALLFPLWGCQEKESVKKPADKQSFPISKPAEQEPLDTPPKEETFDIKLSFTGDMVLCSYVGQPGSGTFEEYAKNNPPEYFLSKVSHIFKSDDITLVNFENVVSDRADLTPQEKNYSPAYWFKSGTERLKILTTAGVDGATLHNNHIYDYGEQGYQDTAAALTNAGIKNGFNNRIMYFEKQGFKIAVICVGLWYSSNTTQAINYLKTAQENSDYQIVFFHGGKEKLHHPEQSKIDAVHALIDAGADLMVGSHPHVLQPKELYKGVEIIYSMGNFCYGGSRSPENRTIIYQMTLTVNKDMQLTKQSSNIIPCFVHTGATSNNYQPAIVEDEAVKKQILQFMNGEIDSPI